MLSSGEYYSGIDPNDEDQQDAARKGTLISMLILMCLCAIAVVPAFIETNTKEKTQKNKNESVYNDSIKIQDTLYNYVADTLKSRQK